MYQGLPLSPLKMLLKTYLVQGWIPNRRKARVRARHAWKMQIVGATLSENGTCRNAGKSMEIPVGVGKSHSLPMTRKIASPNKRDICIVTSITSS